MPVLPATLPLVTAYVALPPIPTKKRQENLTGQATPPRRKKKPKKKRKKTAARQMRLFSTEEGT